jgi:hypothetical protein
VDVEPPRQGAHAGEPLPGAERPREDLHLELGHELVSDGDARAAIEHEIHGYGISSTLGTRVKLRDPVGVTSATSSMRTPPRPR